MPPNGMKFYQLIIRNADDTANDIVVSSAPGVGWVLMERAPDGDGQKTDLLDGTTDIGAYTVAIIDTGVGGADPLTTKLWDSNQRLDLLSRRAYLKWGTDGATFPNMLVPGFVNAIRMEDPALFILDIGETRRVSEGAEFFRSLLIEDPATGTEVLSRFGRFTSLIGGPVRGGFGPVKDYGGWKFRIRDKIAGTDVARLDLVEGWVPTPTGWKRFDKSMGHENWNRLWAIIDPYRVPDETYKAQNILYSYPGLRYVVYPGSGGNTPLGAFMPVSSEVAYTPDYWFAIGHIQMVWPGALPPTGDVVEVYMYMTEVSETNPCHVVGHPVTILADAYRDLGEAVHAGSEAATKDAVGPDYEVWMRPTEGMTLTDLERTLGGVFRFSTRAGPNGERYFFPTRVKPTSVPALTLTKNELREDASPFVADENEMINRVVFNALRFEEWETSEGDYADMPTDYIRVIKAPFEVTNGDRATHKGAKDHVFTLPGMVVTRAGPVVLSPMIQLPGVRVVPNDEIAVALATELFDRWGRGPVIGELRCFDDMVAENGDTFVFSHADFPGSLNARGQSRVVQIAQRTNTPDGPNLEVVDAGFAATVAIVPTFTLAASAGEPQKRTIVTVTNAAALIAAGVERVRVEIGYGVTPPASGTLVGSIDLATGATVMWMPLVNAGAIVHARVRAERGDYLPGDYSAWATVDLPNIPAPSALAVVLVNNTSARATWTNGSANYPTRLYARAANHGESLMAHAKLVAVAPAGSTEVVVEGLDPMDELYFHALHQEDSPFAGASDPSAEVYLGFPTAPAAPSAPSAPVAFAGTRSVSGRVVLDGRIGYEADVTSGTTLEVEVATETAVGSGTPGAYATAGQVSAAAAGRTRLMLLQRHANDGKRRYLRGRARRGSVVSSYSAVVSVYPWGTPSELPVSRRGTRFVETTGDLTYAARAEDSAGTQLPPDTTQSDGTEQRVISKGLRQGTMVDGQVVTFSPPFDAPPALFAGPGGITYKSAGLVGDQRQRIGFTNVSASGFTAVCKVEEVLAATTPRNVNLAFVGGTPNWQANKTQAAEAYDDIYKYSWTVAMQPNSQARVELWINDGSGWTLKSSFFYVSGGTIANYNDTDDILQDGIGLNDDFGIHFVVLAGSAALTAANVAWNEGGTPASVPCTGNGVTIPWTALVGT